MILPLAGRGSTFLGRWGTGTTSSETGFLGGSGTLKKKWVDFEKLFILTRHMLLQDLKSRNSGFVPIECKKITR